MLVCGQESGDPRMHWSQWFMVRQTVFREHGIQTELALWWTLRKAPLGEP